MTLIWEKIVVTAKEFLNDKNINDCRDFNEPMFMSKMVEYDWDLSFSASSILCELVWKIAIGRNNITEYRRLDRLFSPSPIATHSNFRGCRSYRTGNVPERGSLAIWKRGNTWQGAMALVIDVAADNSAFDVIDGRILQGSENRFIQLEERKGKRMNLPFQNDKLNLIGFVYPPNREID